MVSLVGSVPRRVATSLTRSVLALTDIVTRTRRAAFAALLTVTVGAPSWRRPPRAASADTSAARTRRSSRDAQISARNLELGQTRATTANSSGFYSIPGLRPGRYEITIRRLGFAPQSRTIDVPIAQTVTLDVQLQEAADAALRRRRDGRPPRRLRRRRKSARTSRASRSRASRRSIATSWISRASRPA